MTDPQTGGCVQWSAIRVGAEDGTPHGWCGHRHRTRRPAEACAYRLSKIGPDDPWVVVDWPIDDYWPYKRTEQSGRTA